MEAQTQSKAAQAASNDLSPSVKAAAELNAEIGTLVVDAFEQLEAAREREIAARLEMMQAAAARHEAETSAILGGALSAPLFDDGKGGRRPAKNDDERDAVKRDALRLQLAFLETAQRLHAQADTALQIAQDRVRMFEVLTRIH